MDAARGEPPVAQHHLAARGQVRQAVGALLFDVHGGDRDGGIDVQAPQHLARKPACLCRAGMGRRRRLQQLQA